MKSVPIRWYFNLCGALAILSAARAAEVAGDPAAPRAGKIDALFAPWNKPDVPGAAVAVIHHGKVVYERGFGSANLEYDAPIGPETAFHVASVSKQFTAMAVVLLEGDGKLSIDDEVRKYLPELPDYGHLITLRHLLTHTSGIRDQWNTLALAGWDLKDVITQEQILRLLFRQQELNFTPGSRALYSNGGFTLLAEIVRRISGRALPDFCQERIFAPLGMTHTHFHLQLERLVPGRAYSYEPRDRGFVLAPLNYANVGATSLFATAGDLVRWLDNFRAPKAGNEKATARLQEQRPLTSGKPNDFGLGIMMGRYRGLRTLAHGGSDAAFRSYVLWFPEQEFGVAVLSNHARFNPTGLANDVASLYLESEFTEPKPVPPPAVKREAIVLGPEVLDKFAGTFAFDETPDFALTYTRDGARFYAQATGQDRFEIFPESPTKFFYKVVNAQVTFVADPDGTVNRIIHHQNGRDQAGTRTRITATPPELAPLAGHYWSEELETRYTFFVRDGKLFVRHLRHGEAALTHVTGDCFRAPWWFLGAIEFQRDDRGEVTGAKLGGGRVFGVRFDRQPSTDTSLPRPATR